MDTNTDESFEALLRYMRDSRGFDFTGYKRTTLMRRVRHRMTQAGYETFDEYLDVLQASSDEFDALFNTILINVTAFFRDPDAWEYIATDVIPRLLAERGPDAPVRVWSAGCASGQEPTPWPCCWPRRWDPTRSGSGSRSTRPTSTRTPSARRAPPTTTPSPSSRCQRSCWTSILINKTGASSSTKIFAER